MAPQVTFWSGKHPDSNTTAAQEAFLITSKSAVPFCIGGCLLPNLLLSSPFSYQARQPGLRSCYNPCKLLHPLRTPEGQPRLIDPLPRADVGTPQLPPHQRPWAQRAQRLGLGRLGRPWAALGRVQVGQAPQPRASLHRLRHRRRPQPHKLHPREDL